MKKIFRLISFLLLSLHAMSQNWEWARELSVWDDFSKVKEDAAGNKYWIHNDQHTPDSINFTILKKNSTGNTLWQLKVNNAWMNSFILDKTGDLYLVGNIWDTATFGNEIFVPVQGFTSAFICKVNSSGVIAWTKQAIGKGYFDLTSITSDFVNNLYISGRFGEMAILGDSTQLSSLSPNTFFICAYNLSGNLKWAKKADHNTSTCFSLGGGIRLDHVNNILVNITSCNQDYQADSVKYQGNY
ncbi:MAG: hypothetical protein ACJ75J_07625, partial [Cytophagaceae bacterium]